MSRGFLGTAIRIAMAVPCAVVCGLMVGCATPSSQDAVLSEILKDIERRVAEEERTGKAAPTAKADAPDAPDRPVSELPRPPGRGGEKGDEAGEDDASSDRHGPLVDGRGESISIQPDSLLQIKVAEDPGLDGSYHVNEIGAVNLGYIGPVILFNKNEKEAERKIRDILKARDFRNATVSVRILRASYDTVVVSGAVNKPGSIRIGAGDTISLNDALLRAGGLRPSATGAKVRIVRDGLLSAVASSMEGEEFPLVSEDGKPTVPDVELNNNDICFVFSTAARMGVEVGEKEILVLGEVQKPGVYRFANSEPCTMMHLLFKLGSLPPYANKRAVRVIRRTEDGREREFKVNVDRILSEGKAEYDTPLENGDRIIVPARRLSLF